MVSEKMLENFKQLYQKKYHVSLTNEEATEMANDLVNLMSILLTPSSKRTSENAKLNERRKDETVTI